MHEDSEFYIAPELLPESKLTKSENSIIKQKQILNWKEWFALIGLTILGFGVAIGQSIADYFLNDGISIGEIFQNLLFSGMYGWIFLFFLIFEIYYIHSSSDAVGYQKAVRGKIVKMEVIHQTVHIKSDNELMPYQRPGMPEYRDKPASYYSDRKSQPFYYLTIQLENSDKQLRYVNCTKKTFDHLRLGEMVLAVYYGNDKLIGYQIKSEEH